MSQRYSGSSYKLSGRDMLAHGFKYGESWGEEKRVLERAYSDLDRYYSRQESASRSNQVYPEFAREYSPHGRYHTTTRPSQSALRTYSLENTRRDTASRQYEEYRSPTPPSLHSSRSSHSYYSDTSGYSFSQEQSPAYNSSSGFYDCGSRRDSEYSSPGRSSESRQTIDSSRSISPPHPAYYSSSSNCYGGHESIYDAVHRREDPYDGSYDDGRLQTISAGYARSSYAPSNRSISPVLTRSAPSAYADDDGRFPGGFNSELSSFSGYLYDSDSDKSGYPSSEYSSEEYGGPRYDSDGQEISDESYLGDYGHCSDDGYTRGSDDDYGEGSDVGSSGEYADSQGDEYYDDDDGYSDYSD